MRVRPVSGILLEVSLKTEETQRATLQSGSQQPTVYSVNTQLHYPLHQPQLSTNVISKSGDNSGVFQKLLLSFSFSLVCPSLPFFSLSFHISVSRKEYERR